MIGGTPHPATKTSLSSTIHIRRQLSINAKKKPGLPMETRDGLVSPAVRVSVRRRRKRISGRPRTANASDNRRFPRPTENRQHDYYFAVFHRCLTGAKLGLRAEWQHWDRLSSSLGRDTTTYSAPWFVFCTVHYQYLFRSCLSS